MTRKLDRSFVVLVQGGSREAAALPGRRTKYVKQSLWIAIAAAGLSLSGFAAPVTYDVSAIFTTGATVSGTFTLDGTNLINFDIVTSTLAGWPGQTYDASAGAFSEVGLPNIEVPDDFSLFFETPDSSYLMFLWFSGAPAAFAGGPVEPYPHSCAPGDCVFSSEHAVIRGNAAGERYIENGTVQAVPEPGSALLLTAAVLVVAGIRRKRLG